jgi:hypothetical protein
MREVEGEESHVPLIPSTAKYTQSTLDYKERPQKAWTLINDWGTCYTHNISSNNEERALVNRLLGKTPTPTTAFPEFQLKVFDINKANKWETAKHMDANKKGNRYMAAAASLESEPLSNKDAEIKCFMKVEKFYQTAKKTHIVEPRNIQHRDPRFTLTHARYLKPLEEAFMKHYSPEVNNKEHLYTTKGMTLEAKARALNRLWDEYGEAAVCLDGKRHDMHVTVDSLKAKHRYYERHFPGDATLKWLNKHQLRTKGRTVMGRKYRNEGKTCSGDFDTSLGNTGTVMELLRHLRGNLMLAIVVEGDDALVIGSLNDVKKFHEELPKLEEFGFEIEGTIAYSPEEMEFCSARVGRTTMIRNWPTPFKKDCWSVGKYNEEEQKAVTISMAISMLYAYHELPVYSALALRAWNRASVLRPNKVQVEVHKGLDFVTGLEEIINSARRPKSDLDRAIFAIATGVDPFMQRVLEKSCKESKTNKPHAVHEEILEQMRLRTRKSRQY